ncbi:TMEM175 family protein [Oenococcus sp.]|uniref:TMEM175 family protein n=1 Tax=Oenococcus sp. TaxID=1979414 RepID=UPI0039E9D8F3
MSKSRLEAFSDGVFAIIITIMVLELRVPVSGQWQELFQTQFLDIISSYFFSFLFIASFWVSHHTIIAPIQIVDKTLLWVNVLMLFPISLLPFVTAWHSNFPTMAAPNFSYVFIYVLSVLGLYILGRTAVNRVKQSEQQQCRQTNRVRFWLVIFGIAACFSTLLIPEIASFSVLGVLLFWILLPYIYRLVGKGHN